MAHDDVAADVPAAKWRLLPLSGSCHTGYDRSALASPASPGGTQAPPRRWVSNAEALVKVSWQAVQWQAARPDQRAPHRLSENGRTVIPPR